MINKSSIAVSLIHPETGIRVVCMLTRSREKNRELARRALRVKVRLVHSLESS